jgi:hypothetical protein
MVAAHDPLLDADAILALGASEAASVDQPDGVDAVVIASGDPAYAQLDVARCRGLRLVLDAAGLLDPATVSGAGVAYLAIGRPARVPAASEVGS